MGVRRVSESETEYKFHLCCHFPSESVKRDVILFGIVNDITTAIMKQASTSPVAIHISEMRGN